MRLKEILSEQGVSVAELAAKIGVTPSYIYFACSDKSNLSVKQCERIAEALGIPLASLFEGYETRCPVCGAKIRLVADK